MAIVQGIREIKRKNPLILLIYSFPKIGKSVLASKLEDHYILSLEPAGNDYTAGRIDEIDNAGEFEKRLKEFFAEKEKIATYLVVDTITVLDEWSEIVGTYEYMQKAQGKNFNRRDDGSIITVRDKEFESVHSIGKGYGYAHSRSVMARWLQNFYQLIKQEKFDHIILLAHIKDKLIESKSGDVVESSELNLTGKVKTIYSSKVTDVGYLYRKGKKNILSFNNEFNAIAGGRSPHLKDDIVISEMKENGEIETFWDKVFLPNKK